MTSKKAEHAKAPDWQSLDDDILIKAFLKGDASAFEVLFKKYRDHVSRLVYSVVKEESLVDDIVQEVFLLIFRHLHKFRQQSAFKTWMYRITVNEAMRQLGRSKRWQPLPEEDFEPANLPSTLVTFESGGSPERVMIEGQQKAVIQQALAKMKPHHRLILSLYYLEDLSVQEIADVLDIPEGSVKSRLFYARDNLRKQLEPLLAQAESTDSEMKGIHAL